MKEKITGSEIAGANAIETMQKRLNEMSPEEINKIKKILENIEKTTSQNRSFTQEEIDSVNGFKLDGDNKVVVDESYCEAVDDFSNKSSEKYEEAA